MDEVKTAPSASSEGQNALSQRLMRELRAAVLSFCAEEAEPLGNRVKDNLFEASDRSTRVDEQNVLLTAYTALIKGGPNFVRVLKQHLPIAVEKALETDRTSVVIDMTTTQRLKLVEVEDVEREVLILNMVRKLEDFTGETLSPLTLRVCHLKGLEMVHLQLNPFKPETFVRGFVAAWEAFDGNRLSTRVMLRSLNVANFLPLNALYLELNELLIANNVMREERYSIKRSAESIAGALWKRSQTMNQDNPGASAGSGSQSGGSGALSGGGGGAGGGGRGVGDLFPDLPDLGIDQGMVGGLSAEGGSAAPPGWQFNASRFMHQVTLLLETAGSARKRHPDETAAQFVGAPDRLLMARLNDLISESRNARESEEVAGAGPQLRLDLLRNEPEALSATEIDRATIEMLSRVFRFALEDPTIPATLKVLIGGLQLPILKAALEDRAFFVEDDHPARRFVDHLARLGMYWSENPEDSLHVAVVEIVGRAKEGGPDATVLFTQLDNELEALINEREQSLSTRDAEAIADIALEELKHEAEVEVDFRIARRITAETDPPLAEFLQGAWRRAWILYYMTRHEEPERWQTIQEQTDILIWSVLPKLTKLESTELRNSLPELLACLNSALNAIEWAGEERFNFIEYLMDRQAAAVRQTPRQGQPSGSPKPTPADLDVVAESDESIAYQGASQAPTDGFERNQWFALDLGLESPFKYRLSWISPKRTKFVLTTRDGGEALAKTLPELQQLLQSGSMTRIETNPLVGRALAATMSDAGLPA
jgi:uncharacterized membrane protein YgcG